MEEDDDRYVYWVEKRGRGCFLQATPIDVSPILSEQLFDKVDYRDPHFGHPGGGRRLRLHREAAGPGERARPGGPRPFRLPQAGAALRAAAPAGAAQPGVRQGRRPRKWRAFSKHSRGRAFVLFTSYQQMRLVYEQVSFEIDYPTLLQGTGPSTALLEEFRATPHACSSRLPPSGRAWTCRASS